MIHEELNGNEYLDLPDDPELAFAILHKRKFQELTNSWENENPNHSLHERQYVDVLIAFDEVHELGILKQHNAPPVHNNDFADFFEKFRRLCEMTSMKILMENARRIKSGEQNIIVLDATARQAIHKLVSAIKEKLGTIGLTYHESRDSIYGQGFDGKRGRNRGHA